MDTKPIYELRERLRAAAMAGTNLLSEDFRLRRAYEAFKPLEIASPVFAKIGQLTEQLLSPDCPNVQGALLDTLSLADAVICTLGTVEVPGKVDFTETIHEETNAGSLIVNAPYSVLKELLEALTASGGGHYGYVCEVHDNHPELFRDYRVKHALVQALGASYAMLADHAEQWLTEENDKTILPALYKDFDPKGKKEMVRRVKVISALAGAEANDFYVRMLGEAQKDMRIELLGALRHEPGNLSLLFELSKTEKGKNRDKVFELLAAKKEKEVCEFFRELAKKNPETALKYLRNSRTEWAAELVVDIFNGLYEKTETVNSASDKEKKELSEILQDMVLAMFGKGGEQICACYRKLLVRKDQINSLLKETWKKPKNSYEANMLQCGVLPPHQHWYTVDVLDIEAVLGKILHHSLVVNPDSDLQALALELYQNEDSGKTNVKFLSAAVTVKFLDNGICVDWLEKQVKDNALPASKCSEERLKAVIEALNYVLWDKEQNGYKLYGAYVDTYCTDCECVERAIDLPHAKELITWLQNQEASPEIDETLARFVPLNDEAICRETGEFFYRKALSCTDVYLYRLINYMKDCGCTDCKGLGVGMVRHNLLISTWHLYGKLIEMPGDKDAIMEEMRTICSMVKSGELNAKKLNLDELEVIMNRWYQG